MGKFAPGYPKQIELPCLNAPRCTVVRKVTVQSPSQESRAEGKQCVQCSRARMYRVGNGLKRH